MKRHPELLTLSREHHAALKLARHARLAAESGATPEIARLARQAIDTFAHELEPHFQTEEADLLPLLQRAGQHALVERTLDDHRRLRQLGQQLKEPDAATLLAFAELLAEHVRFEERELFETAQNYLPPTP